MFDMTGINGEVDFRFFAMSRMLLSVGLPFVFIPIMTASFAEIPHNKTDMASALINMARNTGGVDRHIARQQHSCASRAVSSEPSHRARQYFDDAVRSVRTY
jgi:hypothetical protein